MKIAFLYRPFIALGICSCTLFFHRLEAQTKCDCSRPDYHAPIGVMIDHAHARKEWMVSFRYMDMRMLGNRMGTNKIDNDQIFINYLMSPDKMTMRMKMVMVMYGLSDKITLMGMVNYVNNSMNMTMTTYGTMNMGNTGAMNMADSYMRFTTKNSGFSETKLYALYKLFNSENQQVLLNVGVSVPTGSISHYGNSMTGHSQKLTYSMQTGTGTWGILPGLTYTGQSRKFSWGVQAASHIKTGKNRAGYKLGDELNLTAWISHSWNSWISNSLRVGGDYTGRIKGFDRETSIYRTVDPTANIVNSGGQSSSVYLGINFLIPKGVLKGNRLGIEFGIPYYQNQNGIQMNNKSYLNAGWLYAF